MTFLIINELLFAVLYNQMTMHKSNLVLLTSKEELHVQPTNQWLNWKTCTVFQPRVLQLMGKGTPNKNWACFVHSLKIINTFLNNNIRILIQIVWGTQKWRENFSRSSGSGVIDQNSILHALINNSRSTWLTKILRQFLNFSDNLLQDNDIVLKKKKKKNWKFWDGTQNILNFSMGFPSP